MRRKVVMKINQLANLTAIDKKVFEIYLMIKRHIDYIEIFIDNYSLMNEDQLNDMYNEIVGQRNNINFYTKYILKGDGK